MAGIALYSPAVAIPCRCSPMPAVHWVEKRWNDALSLGGFAMGSTPGGKWGTRNSLMGVHANASPSAVEAASQVRKARTGKTGCAPQPRTTAPGLRPWAPASSCTCTLWICPCYTSLLVPDPRLCCPCCTGCSCYTQRGGIAR